MYPLFTYIYHSLPDNNYSCGYVFPHPHRVKAQIAHRGGFVQLTWDGFVKLHASKKDVWQAKKAQWTQKQQQEYARHLSHEEGEIERRGRREDDEVRDRVNEGEEERGKDDEREVDQVAGIRKEGKEERGREDGIVGRETEVDKDEEQRGKDIEGENDKEEEKRKEEMEDKGKGVNVLMRRATPGLLVERGSQTEKLIL